jgi:hypothetical protein
VRLAVCTAWYLQNIVIVAVVQLLSFYGGRINIPVYCI